MTFLEIQNDALEDLNLTTEASSAVRDRVKRKINEGYRILMADVGMETLRQTTTTVSVTTGTQDYTITCAKLFFLRDTANDVRLTEVSLGDLRTMDPGDDSTGTPTHYAVIQQPSATTLKVRLWPEPSEDLTLAADILSAVTALASDSDVPVLPTDFHAMLAIYARVREYEKMDDTRYDRAMREYENWARQLRFFLRKSPTRATIQGGGRRGYSSQLGPDFPERQ